MCLKVWIRHEPGLRYFGINWNCLPIAARAKCCWNDGIFGTYWNTVSLTESNGTLINNRLLQLYNSVLDILHIVTWMCLCYYLSAFLNPFKEEHNTTELQDEVMLNQNLKSGIPYKRTTWFIFQLYMTVHCVFCMFPRLLFPLMILGTFIPKTCKALKGKA